jgi:hypothetical protein
MPFTPIHVFDIAGLYGLTAVVVATVILAGAILLLRRDRCWPARLLLIGAVSLFTVVSARFAFVVSFTHGWLQRTPLLEGCVVIPAVSRPVEVIELISYCLWIGLAWYCFRIARTRPNVAIQRTAPRSDA